MNGAVTLPVLIGLVVGLAVPFLGFLGVLVATMVKDRRDKLNAKDVKTIRVEEAAASVQVALVTDRSAWEQRAIARIDSLEVALDEERKKRRELEDMVHTSDRRIGELEGQLAAMSTDKEAQTLANTQLREELLAQAARHTEELAAQAARHRQEMSAVEDSCGKLRAAHDELKEKYDTVVQICGELRAQLSHARGETINAALGMADNIGVAELPPPRGGAGGQGD